MWLKFYPLAIACGILARLVLRYWGGNQMHAGLGFTVLFSLAELTVQPSLPITCAAKSHGAIMPEARGLNFGSDIGFQNHKIHVQSC